MVRIGWNASWTKRQARFTRDGYRYVVTGDNVKIYERDYDYGTEYAVSKATHKYRRSTQRELINAVQTLIKS